MSNAQRKSGEQKLSCTSVRHEGDTMPVPLPVLV